MLTNRRKVDAHSELESISKNYSNQRVPAAKNGRSSNDDGHDLSFDMLNSESKKREIILSNNRLKSKQLVLGSDGPGKSSANKSPRRSDSITGLISTKSKQQMRRAQSNIKKNAIPN